MLTEFRGNDDRVCAIAASSNGQLVASGTEAGVVKTWDAATGTEICTFRGHQNRITGIVFVADRWIVTASADGSAKAWDATSGKRGLPAPPTNRFRSAESADPRVAQAAHYATFIEEANRLQKRHLYDTAANRFRDAVQLRPRYAEPHACLGECLLELGKAQQAITSFKTAVQLQPNSGWYKYRLGVALIAAGEKSEAVVALREASRLLPDLGPLRVSLGSELLGQGQYSDAAGEFREAVKLSPRSPEAHHGLGLAYARLRQWNSAEGEFKKSIELERKYAPAYSDLIECILASGAPSPRQAAYWAQLAGSLGVTIRQDSMEKLQRALSNAR